MAALRASRHSACHLVAATAISAVSLLSLLLVPSVARRSLSRVGVSSGGSDDVLQPLLPASPAGAVLRVPRAPSPDGASVAIAAGDVVVTDAFVRGRCVTLIVAQPRAPAQHLDLSQLTVDVLPLERDVPPSRLLERASWSTNVHVDQGSGAIEACGDAAGVPLDALDVVLRYPGRAPARLSVPRVEALTGKSGLGPAVAAAVCTLVRGTGAAHLAAWIEYHSTLGFGHAYVCELDDG